MQRCDTPLGLLWRFILKCYSTSLHSYRMNETNNKCCFESNARFFSATGWLLPFVAKLRAVPTLLRAVLCQEQGTHSIRMFFCFFYLCCLALITGNVTSGIFMCVHNKMLILPSFTHIVPSKNKFPIRNKNISFFSFPYSEK